jgi:hypothetical protein
VDVSRAEGNALLLAHTVRHLGDLHRAAGRVADARTPATRPCERAPSAGSPQGRRR